MSTIEKIYEAQLAAQKEQLKQNYDQADSDLSHQKQLNQKATDANLTRTAVEAQKAAANNAELHNAYGLSSGTRAQVRLAQENQLQADMTALRAAQQQSDAEVERQRGILAQEYASAIRQAQAENDLAKAEALYEEAQKQQAALQERELAAAQLMAEHGDFTRLAKLRGLSASEVETLKAAQSGTATGLTFDQAMSYYKETGDASVLMPYVSTDQYIDLAGAEKAMGRAAAIVTAAEPHLPHWKGMGSAGRSILLSYIDGRVKDMGGLTDVEMAALYRHLKEKGYL